MLISIPRGSMLASAIVRLFHRRLDPHLDQMQDLPVCHPACYRFHQWSVRNLVEIATQIRIDHRRAPVLIKPCTALTASSALTPERYACCSGCRSASKIGSSTNIIAVCTTRSRIVAILSGLFFWLFGFGMRTLLTACGRYVLFLSSCASSPSHRFPTIRLDVRDLAIHRPPAFLAIRLDVLKRLPVHPGRAIIGLHRA
ncbi:hypothetical protein [Bradyrhizobium japonicum]|uniref:hypothetical protein n=1 Tax=Bradyrhizobium japonicum TaxID=375 RepID=UPI001BA579FF|nr:hypothetical protein [Bradyrhizobium japonicum]MBR0914899.1 hypothetical protein [Bradyrhizobium japonicum]